MIETKGPTSTTPFASYQTRRDTLSTALFNVVDVIAGHRWTDTEIPGLLLQLNAAMADEVEALAELPPLPPAGDPLTQLVQG